MRVRGLKYAIVAARLIGAGVAPHAGAWIEMVRAGLMIEEYVVAPHAGAWIEILFMLVIVNFAIVAPHAGAWIEIWLPANKLALLVSHPMRVRGLKWYRRVFRP